MQHHQNSPTANMHPLLECIFVRYAGDLREMYPGQKIRNATVFASGIPVFERFGYELVDTRTGIREGIPKFLIDRVKRCKRQPVWIPSTNFPDHPSDIYKEMTASMYGDDIVWRHTPSECLKLDQLKDIDTA